tara:strand:- start:551 stop:1414 length:864 start_codon:yes stop_codon:yes gene_type:complete
MKKIKYFIQYILILFLFALYKILGLKFSLILSSAIFSLVGHLFRKNNISEQNLTYAFKNINYETKQKIIKKMWVNYGKIFAEYMFIKDFRNDPKISKKINIENEEILKKIKNNSEPVVFISGHFNNFEFMAMQIEKYGIDLAAIYRPLNNIFLNPIMERIRKKYICKNQIRKGVSGMKSLVKKFKKGTSIALMIDQRVSEGIECNFFQKKAFTTTIPAQFIKKYKSKIVPVYIERLENDEFVIKFQEPLVFNENENIETITTNLNKIIEKMILNNPEQWIWTHNRWK